MPFPNSNPDAMPKIRIFPGRWYGRYRLQLLQFRLIVDIICNRDRLKYPEARRSVLVFVQV